MGKEEYTDWLEDNEDRLIKEFIENKNLSDELNDFLWSKFVSWRSTADDLIHERYTDIEDFD